ncbi:MAG: hypothetical protein ACOWWH_13780 [Eubacteriaceae bacterium]
MKKMISIVLIIFIICLMFSSIGVANQVISTDNNSNAIEQVINSKQFGEVKQINSDECLLEMAEDDVIYQDNKYQYVVNSNGSIDCVVAIDIIESNTNKFLTKEEVLSKSQLFLQSIYPDFDKYIYEIEYNEEDCNSIYYYLVDDENIHYGGYWVSFFEYDEVRMVSSLIDLDIYNQTKNQEIAISKEQAINILYKNADIPVDALENKSNHEISCSLEYVKRFNKVCWNINIEWITGSEGDLTFKSGIMAQIDTNTGEILFISYTR